MTDTTRHMSPDLQRVYLSNVVVHHAIDAGLSLEGCIVALAEAYDFQQKMLYRLLAEAPPRMIFQCPRMDGLLKAGER